MNPATPDQPFSTDWQPYREREFSQIVHVVLYLTICDLTWRNILPLQRKKTSWEGWIAIQQRSPLLLRGGYIERITVHCSRLGIACNYICLALVMGEELRRVGRVRSERMKGIGVETERINHLLS